MTADMPNESQERGDVHDDDVIGQAFQISLVVIIILASAGGGAAWYFTRPDEAPPEVRHEEAPAEHRPPPEVEIPEFAFKDHTEAGGITFVHTNGATGKKLLPETMGGGVSVLDYDSDGDPDVLFVNSRKWDQQNSTGRVESSDLPTMALFQNDGHGNFKDVTVAAQLDVTFYGMGAAIGDYDNDGDPDIYFTAVGSNRLFRNDGGKFVDVTTTASVSGDADQWSTSAGWFDYNNDGRLDLFVCNYLDWNAEYDLTQNFTLVGVGRGYGRPKDFGGTHPYLFRNDGEGKFTDVTESAGIRGDDVPEGKSLGVTFADFNRDGNIDIFVANDTVQNFLFHNLGDGTFRECARDCGAAFDEAGMARGGMGADVGCFRFPDRFGITVGNFTNEMTALYVSQDDGSSEFLPAFEDEANATGLGPNTRLELTFGVFFFDPDLNGRLDVFSSNGHLEYDVNRTQNSQHYEQPPQLLYNCGPEYPDEFVLAPADRCGQDFVKRIVGRGSVYADFDGDGDQDVLIATTGKSPRLLINGQTTGHHWLRVKLTGSKCNRDAIGSWIDAQVNGQIIRRQVMPTRSYMSQVELPVTFGLGANDKVEKLSIRWADGSTQEVEVPKVDQQISITQPSE